MKYTKKLDDVLNGTPFILDKNFYKGRDIIIYGAGRLGKMIANICNSNNIGISFFVDQNSDKLTDLSGYPVLPVSELKNIDTKNSVVLISAVKIPYAQIKSIIESYTSADIHTVYDLMGEVKEAYFTNGWFSGELSEGDRTSIREVYECLADEYSKVTYLSYLNWRVRKSEFKDLKLEIIDEANKYNNQITKAVLSHSKTIVDVGAFDLWFSISSLKSMPLIESVYAFEPDKESFSVCEEVQRDDVSIANKVQLEPYAISGEKGLLNFISGHGLASRLVHESGVDMERVPVTTIDEYFKTHMVKHKIGVIKYHIEGDELSALRASKTTIEKHRPLLMFNCSHNRDCLWAIQKECLALKNYDYYMRSYAYYGEGLTFYAVPRD